MKMKTLKSNRGSTLFVVLFFMVMLSVFAGAAFNYSSGTAILGDRSTIMTQGYGIADGAMELIYARWRQILRATDQNVGALALVTPTQNSLGIDITAVSLTDLNVPAGYLNLPTAWAPTVSITVLDVYGVPYPSNLVVDTAATGYTFKTRLQAANNFIATTLNYEVVVSFGVQSRSGMVPIRLTRHFQRAVAPALQAAIFFENRLELFPGSNMSINGAVHTNGSLYQGTLNSTTNLEFLQQVTRVGEYNQNASATADVVQAGYGFTDSSLYNGYDHNLRFAGNAPVGSDPSQTTAMMIGGIDRQYLQAYDSTNNPNYNNNSLREIIEKPVRRTGLGSTDPSTMLFNDYWDVPTTGDAATNQATIENSRVYNQASIKISLVYNTATGLLDLTNTEIRAATPPNMADGPLLSSVNAPLNTAILNALNIETGTTVANRTRLGVQDARENSGNSSLPDIKATTLDVGALRSAIISSGYNFNGILYIADVTGQDSDTHSYNNYPTASTPDVETSASYRVKHAIMLTNGADLPGSQISVLTDPNRAFTLATENAVYLKGDYNTGGTGAAVPSNSGAVGNPTVVSGYTSVVSAIMADAVSAMSSRFDPTHGYDDFFVQAPSTLAPGYSMAIDNTTGLEVNPSATGFDPSTATDRFTRQAVSTTVNTAVVSGIFQNTDTSVGGGASNLVRFMENWGQLPAPGTYTNGGSITSVATSTRFTYNGSLMQSFFSKEFTSSWDFPSVYKAYNAPKRVVSFDPAFLDRTPPGSPDTKTYTKGAWQRSDAAWEREML
jgi:hypothetical protein